MKKKRLALGIGVAGIVSITAITVPSAIAFAAAAESENFDLSFSTGDWKRDVPVPDVVAQSDHDYALEDAMFIEDQEGNGGWVVPEKDGDLCFIVALENANTAAASCTTPEKFNERGLAVQVTATDSAAEAYLVPDAVAEASNVIHVDPYSADKAQEIRDSLTSDNARAMQDFTVLPLPTPGFAE